MQSTLREALFRCLVHLILLVDSRSWHTGGTCGQNMRWGATVTGIIYPPFKYRYEFIGGNRLWSVPSAPNVWSFAAPLVLKPQCRWASYKGFPWCYLSKDTSTFRKSYSRLQEKVLSLGCKLIKINTRKLCAPWFLTFARSHSSRV